MENNKVKRVRVGITILEDYLKMADDNLNNANCRSRSEFIENAIKFYTGHVCSEVGIEYLATAITRTTGGIIQMTESRICKILFKVAVELAKLSKLLAMGYEFTDEQMDSIHAQCAHEVKSTNGIIRLDLPPN